MHVHASSSCTYCCVELTNAQRTGSATAVYKSHTHTNLSKPARHVLAPFTLPLISYPQSQLPERDHGHSATIQVCISAPRLCQRAKGAWQYAVICAELCIVLPEALAPNILTSSTYSLYVNCASEPG